MTCDQAVTNSPDLLLAFTVINGVPQSSVTYSFNDINTYQCATTMPANTYNPNYQAFQTASLASDLGVVTSGLVGRSSAVSCINFTYTGYGHLVANFWLNTPVGGLISNTYGAAYVYNRYRTHACTTLAGMGAAAPIAQCEQYPNKTDGSANACPSNDPNTQQAVALDACSNGAFNGYTPGSPATGANADCVEAMLAWFKFLGSGVYAASSFPVAHGVVNEIPKTQQMLVVGQYFSGDPKGQFITDNGCVQNAVTYANTVAIPRYNAQNPLNQVTGSLSAPTNPRGFATAIPKESKAVTLDAQNTASWFKFPTSSGSIYAATTPTAPVTFINGNGLAEPCKEGFSQYATEVNDTDSNYASLYDDQVAGELRLYVGASDEDDAEGSSGAHTYGIGVMADSEGTAQATYCTSAVANGVTYYNVPGAGGSFCEGTGTFDPTPARGM